jgi:hypothetical protein
VAPHFGKIQAINKRYQLAASAIPAFTVQLGLTTEERYDISQLAKDARI